MRLQTSQEKKEGIRLTVGSDILDYSGDVATSTADITPLQILTNSTLSTEYAAVNMIDIKKTTILALRCHGLNT
jgi:hypothetical protein